MNTECVLADFGIAGPAERAWRLLVENPGATTADLRRVSGFGELEVRAALEKLAQRQLIHKADSPSGYLAYEPKLAVDVLIAAAQRDLAERSERLANNQAALSPLSELYVRGRIGAGIDRGIETVTSLDAIRDQITLAAKQARTQVRAILKFATATGNREARARDPGMYHRGLAQRTIVDLDDLTDPEYYEALAENSRDGDEVRSMVNTPTQLLMYDDELAVLPIDVGQPTLGAMFIRERAIIDTLVHMFEHYWREATPVYVESLDGAIATRRQTRVLELLAGGLTDPAIARALDIGVRTIRREVGALRDLLGVNSRTEIVAAAIRRGWL